MTVFGINPSFCNWSSRLPLFAQPFLRAKQFEVFGEDGFPTKEASPLDEKGWPVEDGRWHGVRLFGGMDGTMPEFSAQAKACKEYRLQINPGQAAFVSWKKTPSAEAIQLLAFNQGLLHEDSLRHLDLFPTTVVRTLDWQKTNAVQDLSKSSMFQGSDLGMSVAMQAQIVESLNGHMWWCVPPRYETPVELYKEQIRQRLRTIQENTSRPVILEYGNELWNPDFPAHHVLAPKWYKKAAAEIAILKDVADQVFGEHKVLSSKPYYLFAGSQFGSVDSTALIITELDTLGITPDLAGPAFYVGPKRDDVEFWSATDKIPTQADLQHSCYARLGEMKSKLFEHVQVVKALGVPHFALYECGQSFIAKGKPWRQAAIEAQKTNWLGSLIRDTKKTIQNANVDLACWYSACTDQNPDNKMVDVFGFSEGLGKPILPKAKNIAS